MTNEGLYVGSQEAARLSLRVSGTRARGLWVVLSDQ